MDHKINHSLIQKFDIRKRSGQPYDTFICGNELGPQFLSEGQIDAVINRKICRKGKMQGVFKEPLGRSDNFHAEIKESGQDRFGRLFGNAGFKPQYIHDFIKGQVRNDDINFVVEKVFLKLEGGFGIGFADKPLDQDRSVENDHLRESRILRMIFNESKFFSALPYFCRNSSMIRDALDMARRFFTRLLIKSSIFISSEINRIIFCLKKTLTHSNYVVNTLACDIFVELPAPAGGAGQAGRLECESRDFSFVSVRRVNNG